MVNATLMEALGNKDTLKGVMNYLEDDQHSYRTEGNAERNRDARKMDIGNEIKRKLTERHTFSDCDSETEEYHKNLFNNLYESGVEGRNQTNKDYQKGRNKQPEIQIDCNNSFRQCEPYTLSNFSSSK